MMCRLGNSNSVCTFGEISGNCGKIWMFLREFRQIWFYLTCILYGLLVSLKWYPFLQYCTILCFEVQKIPFYCVFMITHVIESAQVAPPGYKPISSQSIYLCQRSRKICEIFLNDNMPVNIQLQCDGLFDIISLLSKRRNNSE